MNDREVLVITIKLDYSKAQSTEYWYCGNFATGHGTALLF